MQFDDTLRHALLYRFIVINVFALALVAVAGLNGWIAMIVATDTTRVVLAIMMLFVYGLGLSAFKAWKLNQIANAFRLKAPLSYLGWGNVTAESLKSRAGANLNSLKTISTLLFMVGLVGTIIGLSIAMGGVDPVAAADVAKVGGMVGTLIHGLAVKFYSSMVALMLAVWTIANTSLLTTETHKIIAKALEAKAANGDG